MSAEYFDVTLNYDELIERALRSASLGADGRRAAPWPQDVPSWEGQMMADLGALILRYLAAHPCPAESERARELEDWAQRLRARGVARLKGQGRGPLREVD